jgi:hypothetical protein
VFGIVSLTKLIAKQWTEYRKTIDLQRRLIKVLLEDRNLQAGSFIQQIEGAGTSSLTSTTHFFFSNEMVEAEFIKNSVENTVRAIIDNYKPEDSCQCTCHVPIRTNVIPFPYLDGLIYDD